MWFCSLHVRLLFVQNCLSFLVETSGLLKCQIIAQNDQYLYCENRKADIAVNFSEKLESAEVVKQFVRKL